MRRVGLSEWERVRSIRLESLRDPAAGIAFVETLEQGEQHPSGFWRERTASVALSGSAAQFVAEVGRDWVGTVTVLIPDPEVLDSLGRAPAPGRARVVAVYIRPSQRGRGILGSLLDAAGEWAREQGQAELALDVHEDNARAQAAYRRAGFVATGETVAGPNGVEQEMLRPL